MEIIVYTDGACSRNGQAGAKAGLGVYFSEGDIRNCSERIEGKQTNNTAEIKAILKAADILKREILAGFPIKIYSDSEDFEIVLNFHRNLLFSKLERFNKKLTMHGGRF